MRGFMVRAFLVLACFTSAFTLGTALHMVPASAASVSQFTGSHSTRWWDAATCRAFSAGDVHSMVLDSRHAGGWLRADVAHLAHDARSHASHEVIVNDQLNVSMDCHEQG